MNDEFGGLSGPDRNKFVDEQCVVRFSLRQLLMVLGGAAEIVVAVTEITIVEDCPTTLRDDR